MTVTWEQLGYSAEDSAVVRDMFSREDLGEFTGDIRLFGRRSDLAMTPMTRLQRRAVRMLREAWCAACGWASHSAL